MTLSRRLRIIWDLDDTLNDLMGAWLTDFRWRHQTAVPAFAALRENPPHRVLGITREQYLASLDAFRLSSAGRQLPPVPEIAAWFQTHGVAFEHHVLTARPLATVPSAAEWTFMHFGRWIRSFHFVPAPRPEKALPSQGRAKSELIRAIGGADVFIDDSEVNFDHVREVVRQCLLVPKPWNGASGTLADLLRSLGGTA